MLTVVCFGWQVRAPPPFFDATSFANFSFSSPISTFWWNFCGTGFLSGRRSLLVVLLCPNHKCTAKSALTANKWKIQFSFGGSGLLFPNGEMMWLGLDNCPIMKHGKEENVFLPFRWEKKRHKKQFHIVKSFICQKYLIIICAYLRRLGLRVKSL